MSTSIDISPGILDQLTFYNDKMIFLAQASVFSLKGYKEELVICKETLRIGKKKNHISTCKNVKQQWKSKDFREVATHGLSK